MFMILTLIVLVAALNIISGLIMLVKDKGRDIAILRTMGATRGAIMRIFFMTGAAIGIVGTLPALLLGVLVCAQYRDPSASSSPGFQAPTSSIRELYFLSQLPAEMDLERNDHRRRHGAGALLHRDHLSRPGAPPGSIRSQALRYE